MRIILFLAIVLTMAQLSFSQAFIVAANNIPMNTETIVTKTDGSIITGKIRTAGFTNGFLKNFRLKDENGTIFKFKSNDVQSIKAKPGLLSKLDMISDKTSSLNEIINTDFNEIIEREWIFFERVISPKKNKKPLLLQQLNPGFDAIIKIYNNPGANESGTLSLGETTISGGEDRSYIAVKNNGETFYLRKSKYGKKIKEKFNDCEAFNKQFKNARLKFKNAAWHVFFYNEKCE